MISAGNKNMQEAGETLFTLNEDDRIRDQCEAREDYRRTWDGVKQMVDELQREVERLKALNMKKDTNIEKKDTAINELKLSNEKKDVLISSLETQIADLQQRLQNSIN